MPRKLRLYLPNQPQHVVVRGHNRDPVMARHEDFQFMYKYLKDASEKYALKIHAWVLMNNHIHMLATPSSAQCLPSCMQSLGRRYAQYFNRRHDRSGALWEGRYKSMLVDSDSYLLTCYRYIELNPVRAGIVRHVKDYLYSSYACNALGETDAMVTEHELYTQFTADGLGAYVSLFDEALSAKELADIRSATLKGLGVGNADFLSRVAKLSRQQG